MVRSKRSTMCARANTFFAWYNEEHYHTGLNLLTPASVYDGQAEAICQQRQLVLRAAYAAHPERFSKGLPVLTDKPSIIFFWVFSNS